MRLFKKKSVLKEVLKNVEYPEWEELNWETTGLIAVDVSREYSEDSWNKLDINDSNESARGYGVISFYTKDGDFSFRTAHKVDFKNKEYGKDFQRYIKSYVRGDKREPSLEEFYSIFPEIIFVPKYSDHPNYMLTSVYDLLAWYDLYREIPSAITNHPKHGKYYEGKNIYRKLELIK